MKKIIKKIATAYICLGLVLSFLSTPQADNAGSSGNPVSLLSGPIDDYPIIEK